MPTALTLPLQHPDQNSGWEVLISITGRDIRIRHLRLSLQIMVTTGLSINEQKRPWAVRPLIPWQEKRKKKPKGL